MPDALFSPSEFLHRAAEKCGFIRERYVERNIPTDIKDILVLLAFPDYKSRFILSSLLLKNYIKKVKIPRYSIICSYQGDQGLYPYVDEFWSPLDRSSVQDIMVNASGFGSISPSISTFDSNLLRYFPGDVFNSSIFDGYYKNGLTDKFFKDYKNINYYLPSIPALPLELAKRFAGSNYTVFLHPSRYLRMYRNGRDEMLSINMQFWSAIVDGLLNEGITPVLWMDHLSYDLSPVYVNKCIYISHTNILNILSAMRASTCVLDVCSGISRLALMARTPFVSCDTRQRFFTTKEYELDDLCSFGKIPKQYVFLFSNSLEIDWGYSLSCIIYKLKRFLPTIDKIELMGSAEFDDNIEYDVVREVKSKKIGLHFIKVKLDDI